MNLPIEIIDYRQFTLNKETALYSVIDAFRKDGCFFLTYPCINVDLMKEGKKYFKDFFTTVPLDTRMAHSYITELGMKGYMVETLMEIPKNLNEQYFDVSLNNVAFVGLLPSFQRYTNLLWHAFNNLSEKLMRNISLTLDQPHDYFEDQRCREGCSVLRGIYFLGERKPRKNDIFTKYVTRPSVITLLSIEKGSELQILQNGEWVPVTMPDSDFFLISVGNVLKSVTNGIYKTPIYQILSEPCKELASMLFFHNVHHDFNSLPLPLFELYKQNRRI